MQKTILKKSILASSIIGVFIGGQGSVIAAEDTNAQDSEVIQVTGIRSSLVRSADIKRNATGIVDAISSEDIGKFPDTNLAESLQRITGVSISRENGEGSEITVRGIDPKLNLVTLNGRTLARTTGQRSFNFQSIASEMVSGVEVYKTADASVTSGGIGATVNLTTLKPLENPGQKALISVKAMDDQSSEDGSITPEFSGFYSNTFLNNTLGVSIGGSYQERENGRREAALEFGWLPRIDSEPGWYGAPQENQVNRPGEDEIYSLPGWLVYRFTEQQHERLNLQTTLQWAPTEDITITADYNRFDKSVSTQNSEYSTWIRFAGIQAVWNDDPIATPILYSESQGLDNPDESTIAAGAFTEDGQIDAFGLNLDWKVNDKLSLEIDASTSSAELKPGDKYGSENLITFTAYNRQTTSIDFTGEIPALIVTDGNSITSNDFLHTGMDIQSVHNSSDITQLQVNGEYKLDYDNTFEFGVGNNEIKNHGRYIAISRTRFANPLGEPGDYPEELWHQTGVVDRFDAGTGDFSETLANGNTLADGTVLKPENIQNVMYEFDFKELVEKTEELYPADEADTTQVGDCGTYYCMSTDYSSYVDERITEDTNYAYLQYNHFNEIADMPFDVHLGIRYEETEVKTISSLPTYLDVRWVLSNSATLTPSGEQEYFDNGGSYDHFLPNLNFNLSVTDDVKVRASVSKTIGRADYEELRGGAIVNAKVNPFSPDGDAGNPQLKPLESNNYDLSVEWYYDDSSYASIGYFKKDISNNITTGKIPFTLDGIYNPTQGPKAEEARANVADPSNQALIRNYILENFSDRPEVTDNSIIGIEEDGLMEFLLDAPVNGTRTNTVTGFEAAVQHMFGESGFGAIVNYTLVDSDLDYDVLNLSDQEVMLGISDSANLVGFYDKDGINVRVAYNWRDDFLESRTQPAGIAPVFTEGYQQIDLSASYDINDSVQVFIQGINVTGEDNRQYNRTKIQLMSHIETGARWLVGGRYTF